MQRILLDTHALIWWLRDAPELGNKARNLLANRHNQVLVSAASIWEIQIKRGIGKLSAPDGLLEIIEDDGMIILDISGQHAEQINNLPHHHRDPFDRMLIAQAQIEGLTILTSDKQIVQYGVRTLSAKI
ncbi:MAG: type II toxin-antitoxin system VapC family toxin [Magnetococcales bacterium]|nr:type II toxin-antitoxin system VapC family toxin [Magnetococcales bacterium]